jgi:predicted negative regulator of RcsB-dependent stress response
MTTAIRPVPLPSRSPLAWLPELPWLRWTILGVAAIVVAALIAGAGWAWWNSQQASAREALTRAMVLLEESKLPGATPETRGRAEQSLEQVLAQHPRSGVAAEAAYRLGNSRYEAGQYAAARGAFEVAIARGATGTLRTMAALGIAYTWEAERNLSRAQAALEGMVAGRTGKDFLYEETLMDLARVQERAGNRQAALDTYRRILREVPATHRGDDIRSRIATLESLPKS